MTGRHASPGAENQGNEDRDIAGFEHNPIPHLDGNAAAGPLWEVFRIDGAESRVTIDMNF